MLAWNLTAFSSGSSSICKHRQTFDFISEQHQFSSIVQSCLTLQPYELQHARPPCPSPTPRVPKTHVHQVSDAIQPSHPLSSPSHPALNPSQHQGLFQWVNPLHEVAKVLGFQLQHHSFQRNPRVDLLAVQGTRKSLFQHHCSKASILQHSAFFTVQLSHRYMTTGKSIALTRWTFVGKVMSLLFNMLSRLVITFLYFKLSGTLLIPYG